MSNVKWTKEQKEAIDTRNCNLLVAAAAGSGKTAVLVERIIKIISNEDNQIDIDKLLVVTFTNAAASEMKERIAKVLIKKLEEEPNSKRFQKQLMLLPKSNIMTLHSFCLNIIKNNFNLIDLDPDFRVGDDTENILLKQETLDELFEEKYDAYDEDFLHLVDIYCNNKSDLALQNIILDLYDFAISSPDPKTWILNAVEDFNLKNKNKILENKKKYLNNFYDIIKQLKKMSLIELEILNGEAELEPYVETIKSDIEILDNIESNLDNWDNFISVIQSIKFKAFKRCKKGANASKQQKVKSIRDSIKKSLTDIQDEICGFTNKNIEHDFEIIYPILKTLSNLVIEFHKKFQKKKRDRGIIDFNDFEHICLKIIQNEEVSKELKAKYDEILVDEYQDINLIQETIINAIKKDESNVFMVGDIKQSIYRFRQAKPELFLQKYNNYSKEEGKDRKILLYKNFRSRSEIVNAINFIFKQIMSKDIGEIDYGEEEKLNLGSEFKETNDNVGGPVELNIIDFDKCDDDKTQDKEDVSKIQLEAKMVVQRISKLVNEERFKVYDKETNEYRNVQFKDIVVLLRSTKNWAEVFLDEFEASGIPVYADANTGYFDTIEIKTMMSLLEIIDNPFQDIPLLALMNSPIGGFSQEDIIEIKTLSKKQNYFEKIKDIISLTKEDETIELRDNLKLKLNNLVESLDEWKDKSKNMPLDEFIWYLYKNTGYYGYVGAMPNGEQRQANLRILFERAKQYESTSYKGLFNFINFINKLKLSSGDMGSAKIIGENENVVRIMSIHKSKGLEFPVVFVSGMGKKFNLMDMNKKILFHEKLGFGPDCIDLDRRISYPSIMKQIIKKRIKVENLSEEMRILYVAFTRAKEKLIITGLKSNLGEAINNYSLSIDNSSQKLSKYQMLNSTSYLDWIMPSLIRHKDADILLNVGDINDIKVIDDDSKWKIRIWKKSEIMNQEIDLKDEFENDFDKNEFKVNEKIYNDIDKKLNYKYKYLKSSNMPTVVTVTELKRGVNSSIDGEENYSFDMFTPSLVKKPVFLQEKKGLSPAERGTIMHFVMQKIDLDKTETYDEIKKQIELMKEKEFITEEEAKCVNINKILMFFKSDLGIRMKKSKNIKREIAFHININSTDIYKDLDKEQYKDEKIMLQGIIDCYFEEDDKIILLDYKTDFVEDEEKIKQTYKVQLEYYKMALEKITGKTVSEKYLYLFYNNNAVLI